MRRRNAKGRSIVCVSGVRRRPSASRLRLGAKSSPSRLRSHRPAHLRIRSCLLPLHPNRLTAW
eukprot:3952695-Prymnesium_polylepis.1